MSFALGLDSSTQSLSAVLIDTESGQIVSQESVNFGRDCPEYGQESGFIPGGAGGEVHSDPLMWLDALDRVFVLLKANGCPLDQIDVISGSGQQHGSVYCNEQLAPALIALDPAQPLSGQLAKTLSRKTAPIWMDTSTGAQCREITEAAGGAEEVCRRSGSIAIERFTGPQIRKFAQQDPAAWASTASIHLVSSFLASVLAGQEVAIDSGDGAGMNLMNLATSDWDPVLLDATAENLREKLPAVAPASTVVGCVSSYFALKYGLSEQCQVTLWSGDNPCSLVGMGAAQPGKIVISLGTSDTLFAAMPKAVTDPRGYGHVFGNPVGGYMSLICFRNGSLAREAVKGRFQLTWADFDQERLSQTPAGNGGRVILPYVEDEITPRVSSADYQAIGWEDSEPSPAEVTRGILEGQFLNMKHHADWLEVETTEILLTGGASENDGIAQIIADIFGKKVRRLEVAGSAGLGAAMRAAAAIGADLTDLEDKFSAPAEGKDIEPCRENTAIYESLAKQFSDALQSRFNLS